MIEKSPSEEELMRQFIKALKSNKEQIPNVIRFIERTVKDSMGFCENGFQPIFSVTIYAKQVGDKLELEFRVTRTSDTKTYEVFKIEKFGELINNAIEKYGKEVWDMKSEHERVIGEFIP